MKIPFSLMTMSIFYLLSCSAMGEPEVESAYCVELPHADDTRRNICDRADKQFLVLEFIVPSCSHCQQNAPQFKVLESTIAEWAHTRIISLRDLRQTRSYIERFDITTDVALDERSQVGRQYNIRQVPTTVVINQANEIIHRVSGVLRQDDIDRILELVKPAQ